LKLFRPYLDVEEERSLRGDDGTNEDEAGLTADKVVDALVERAAEITSTNNDDEDVDVDDVRGTVSGRATTTRKYRCDLCGRAFSRSNTLVTHRVRRRHLFIVPPP